MDRRCEILIVDDEPIVGERLMATLQKDGHVVEAYTDPAEAMQRLEATTFDILVCDIRMGEINGLEVMTKALSESPRTKVVMITGYATLGLAREYLTKGAFDFIAKPFKLREIRKVIGKAIAAIDSEDAALDGGA